MTELYINLIAFAVSAVLILGYHLYLRARLRYDPAYTIQAVNAQARVTWVDNIMSGSGKDILAVQTLRNSTMAATFLASTAILLIMGVINMMPKGDAGTPLLESLHRHAVAGDLATLKLLPFLVVFFCAFFCFSQAVRLYNHVGYLINSASGGRLSPTPALVARVLNRSGRYYSLGMRAYYLSVPLVFWLFGPWYLIAGAVGLVAVLYHVDRTPVLMTPAGAEQGKPAAQPHPATHWGYVRHAPLAVASTHSTESLPAARKREHGPAPLHRGRDGYSEHSHQNRLSAGNS